MNQVQLIAYFTFLSFFNIYWYITYFLAIRRGFMEKTWGIPMASLTLNLAWDISGSFIAGSPFLQVVANMGFMLCNLFITYQMFRFWRSDFKNMKGSEFFYFWLLAQIASFAIILLGKQEMNDPLLVEIGYVDNFINSALFIAMLYRREGLLGQSIYIGISKFIGTSSVSAMWFIFRWPGTTQETMLFLIAGIAILDISYIVLYYRKAKELGIDVLAAVVALKSQVLVDLANMACRRREVTARLGGGSYFLHGFGECQPTSASIANAKPQIQIGGIGVSAARNIPSPRPSPRFARRGSKTIV